MANLSDVKRISQLQVPSMRVVLKTNANTGETVEDGDHVFVDVTSGATTLNLPASPSLGARVKFTDREDGGAGGGGLGWGSNIFTVGRNGSTIDYVASDLAVPINNGNGVTLEFVYNGTTWRLLPNNTENSGEAGI